jgi:hypothetical protein
MGALLHQQAGAMSARVLNGSVVAGLLVAVLLLMPSQRHSSPVVSGSGVAAPTAPRTTARVSSDTRPAPVMHATRRLQGPVVAEDMTTLEDREALALMELEHEQPRVRAHAILRLGDTMTTDAGEALARTIYDPHLTLSTMAADQIRHHLRAGLVEPAVVVPIARDRDLHRKTRLTMVGSVSKVKSPEATDLLLDLLYEGDAEERRATVGLLPRQGLDVAVPAIIDALADPDRWVVYNAREQLERIGRGRDFGTDQEAWRQWWEEEVARAGSEDEG